MKKIVGIRFKPAGKVYDFECGAFVLKSGDHVIVETEQGFGLGTVVIPPAEREQQASERPLKKVFRLASEKDFIQKENNIAAERRAHSFCLKCIKELGLKMNLFSVESSFDASKFTFYFTADGRVDFRQLVKRLVKKLNIRVEMRQVGIRNQAKMCGGIGKCGRNICCSSFIEKFNPVSIRMAKEQGLSLNPTKISGLCGRLMCCLVYEHDTYKELRKGLPKIGKIVSTKNGKGKVLRHNVINKRATIRYEGGQEIDTHIEEIIKEG
ncbi:stage 0 sporulation family protein [Thermodesulfobacteriota bacterium]